MHGAVAADAENDTCLSAKTASSEAWKLFLADTRRTLEAVFANRLQKKWARGRFRTWIARHHVVDSFFQGVKKACGRTSPHIAYGDASFSSTGSGELSAPTTFLLKRAQLAFGSDNVTRVDEFCTSKCCATCGSKLQKVVQSVVQSDGTRATREVRGLRRCDSTYCRKFLDRDANAARNILAVFKGLWSKGLKDPTHRPPSLRRDCETSRGPLSTFHLPHTQAVSRMPRESAILRAQVDASRALCCLGPVGPTPRGCT